jgi:hypothetical protein
MNLSLFHGFARCDVADKVFMAISLTQWREVSVRLVIRGG